MSSDLVIKQKNINSEEEQLAKFEKKELLNHIEKSLINNDKNLIKIFKKMINDNK